MSAGRLFHKLVQRHWRRDCRRQFHCNHCNLPSHLHIRHFTNIKGLFTPWSVPFAPVRPSPGWGFGVVCAGSEYSMLCQRYTLWSYLHRSKTDLRHIIYRHFDTAVFFPIPVYRASLRAQCKRMYIMYVRLKRVVGHISKRHCTVALSSHLRHKRCTVRLTRPSLGQRIMHKNIIYRPFSRQTDRSDPPRRGPAIRLSLDTCRPFVVSTRSA